jgi:integrase
VKSARQAREDARATAGLPELQLRDLRHESRIAVDEAGVPTNYVSKILGHSSLSTTTRFLNIQRRFAPARPGGVKARILSSR